MLKGEKKGTVLKEEETSPKDHKLRDKKLQEEKTSILATKLSIVYEGTLNYQSFASNNITSLTP